MLGIDTNVLIRFFTRDDERQFEHASRLIGAAENGGLFVSPIVLVELSWVLRSGYGHKRDEILNVLDRLLEVRQFTIGDRDIVRQAITNVRSNGGDFADALISLCNKRDGCEDTVTFDKRAIRLEGMRLLA